MKWLAGGANPGGALGDGASEASASAVRVVDGAGAIANVSVGRAHACAVVDGTVRCWGSNWYGELGTGAAGERAMAPVELKLPAQKVVAGARHTCALLTDGGVRCWGDGSSGQVGDGNLREENASPLDVQGLGSSVVDISAGGEHTCALLADGRVQCWGANWWGQLGEGTTALRNRPVFAAIKDVVAISAGGGHTCAVTSSGAAYCWGDNAHGQLGDGAWEDQASPVPVIGLESGVVAIATGSAHTCALLQSGVTRCWGSNAGGLPGASGA